MADPISWFVIEPAEVVGDSSDDIFNGLAIATSAPPSLRSLTCCVKTTL